MCSTRYYTPLYITIAARRRTHALYPVRLTKTHGKFSKSRIEGTLESQGPAFTSNSSSTSLPTSKTFEMFVKLLRAMLSVYGLASLQNANRLREEALLTYYADKWRWYTAGTQYVHRVFSYLNRSWVAEERRQKYKNVYPVYTV